MFTKPFIQAQMKQNIKAARHWPVWGEFTGDRWIPLRASNAEMFPFDDVIMMLIGVVRQTTDRRIDCWIALQGKCEGCKF